MRVSVSRLPRPPTFAWFTYIIKSQGVHGLAKGLKWLYSYFHPSVVKNMKPSWFIILTRKGCVGYGIFPEVEWHKQEKENIIKAVGLDIEYVKPSEAKEAEDRGAYKTVSDEKHAEIVALRMEGLGYHKIAEVTEQVNLNHPRSSEGPQQGCREKRILREMPPRQRGIRKQKLKFGLFTYNKQQLL